MRKHDAIEERLALLAQMDQDPLSQEALKELGKALRSGHSLLAAKAAAILADHSMADEAPALVTAFARFMTDPVKTDKGCHAKNAIVAALYAMDCPETDVFLRGVRHVQQEPMWGKPEDTAANLRANSALALARFGGAEARFEAVALLTDPEPVARHGAVKALAYLGQESDELLLRLKALTGDVDPNVAGACLSALMQMAPDHSMPFVTRFLDDADPALVEGAALALGESHTPEAFTVLRDRWERSIEPNVKRMLALPLALTRQDEAFAFLLDVVREAHKEIAVAAIEALKIYRDQAERQAQIHEAVEARHDRVLSAAYRTAFE